MLRVEKFGYTHNFFIGFDSKYRDFLSIFFHFFTKKYVIQHIWASAIGCCVV